MARISHIRGILLEEVLLHLLRGSGYKTVDSVGMDRTLRRGPSGLEVRGRGYSHQIDAIADFQIQHPFSHPQRLLVEAKCFAVGKLIGIDIARNAIGVIKDASEYWVPSAASRIPKSRYHYQYALFSATGYTEATQRYAYAQDVYLIPLGKSKFMTSAMKAIREVTASDFGASPAGDIPVSLQDFRRVVRENLRSRAPGGFPEAYSDALKSKLMDLIQEALQIRYALLGVLGRFPIFLTPNTELEVAALGSVIFVTVRWDDQGWYLDSVANQRLFSFDLPPELFELYARDGVLSRHQAINLKYETMRSFYAFLTIDDAVRVIRFELDNQWLETIRESLRKKSTSSEGVQNPKVTE